MVHVCDMTVRSVSHAVLPTLISRIDAGCENIHSGPLCGHICTYVCLYVYGLATISRLLKIVGLFCRISSLLWGSFAKETYNFKEPTNRSHLICVYRLYVCMYVCLYVCVYTCLHVCMHVCVYVCMSMSTKVCTFVCLYVCMYVCMHVCCIDQR